VADNGDVSHGSRDTFVVTSAPFSPENIATQGEKKEKQYFRGNDKTFEKENTLGKGTIFHSDDAKVRESRVVCLSGALGNVILNNNHEEKEVREIKFQNKSVI